MRTVMVRYKTKDSQAAGKNAELVRAVFQALRKKAPNGIRYACYQHSDGVTFVHVATLDSAENNPLTTLPEFGAFQKEIGERCVEPPVVTEASVVDQYGWNA